MPIRIVLAEDAPAIVDVLQLLLEAEGYEVSTASNGVEVMHLVQDWQPDLILLDVWLPGISGGDLCLQIKQEETFKQIPLLLISAHHEIQKVAEEAGADGYLRKPFTKNVLVSTIALALQPQTETGRELARREKPLGGDVASHGQHPQS